MTSWLVACGLLALFVGVGIVTGRVLDRRQPVGGTGQPELVVTIADDVLTFERGRDRGFVVLNPAATARHQRSDVHAGVRTITGDTQLAYDVVAELFRHQNLATQARDLAAMRVAKPEAERRLSVSIAYDPDGDYDLDFVRDHDHDQLSVTVPRNDLDYLAVVADDAALTVRNAGLDEHHAATAHDLIVHGGNVMRGELPLED